MKTIYVILFWTTTVLSQDNGPEADADISKYVIVLLGSFIGSTISYYFTRRKFQKDQLYLNKVETYKNLINRLIEFNDIEIHNPDVRSLSQKWVNLVTEINKAYLFLPESFSSNIRAMINTVNSKFANCIKYKEDQLINPEIDKTYYLQFYSLKPNETEKKDWVPSDVFLNFDILGPFIRDYQYILAYLKRDIENNWFNFLKNKIEYNKHYKNNTD